MTYWVDILGSVAVFMGATVLVFMMTTPTPAKKVGVMLASSVGGWAIIMLIITGIISANTGG